jgi:two-component system cell cycle sensor histidine kinase/response regulator CckA
MKSPRLSLFAAFLAPAVMAEEAGSTAATGLIWGLAFLATLLVLVVVGLVIAIKARHRTSMALVESEAHLRNIFRAANNVGFIFVDVEPIYPITDFSPGAEIIFGYSRDEIVGKRVMRLYPDANVEGFDAATFGTAWNREFSGETKMMRKDGRVFPAITSILPVKNDKGKTVGAVGVVIDITTRKRLEEEQRSLAQKLQHAQKLESLAALAGGIAHDFNNLLVGVLGNADLAVSEISTTSSANSYLEEIRAASLSAKALTTQMLAYSGKGRFLVEPTNLNEVVESMSHLIEVSCSKKAYLNFNLVPDLPLVSVDVNQIRQLVMNLATNASEAIGDKNGMVTIATGTIDADKTYLATTEVHDQLREGVYVYIEVADTGGGMDAATKAKLFDPFFSTKFAGRGLGLAASLGIVRGHNGTIKVYSELGKGSTFMVLFPASDASAKNSAPRKERKKEVAAAAAEFAHSHEGVADEHATPEPERPIPAIAESAESLPPVRSRTRTKTATISHIDPASRTILIVDDDEAIRRVAGLMLSKKGFTVLTAADGQEGLDTFREQQDKIDLVLLDLTMPVLNGEELFRELRRIDPNVRVLLASGYSEEEATKRFAGRGLSGFVRKPFEGRKLLAAIAEQFD